MFYPQRHRSHLGTDQKDPRDLADTENSPSGGSEAEFKARFAVVLDKLEQLPAIMTITQLLSSSRSISASSDASSDEKEYAREPSLLRPVSVDALRLIELTDRDSAVMMSAEADYLLQTDPIVSVIRTFGALNHVPVKASISVVNDEDFPVSVARHVEESSSQMLLVPLKIRGNEGAASSSGFNPFDHLFRKTITADHSSEAVNSHYIRKVFAGTKADVCLIIDRGLSASGTPGDQHIFLPFFGGPDDRLALSLVVQLCAGNFGVTASVVRIKKAPGADASGGTDEVGTTIHNVGVFILAAEWNSYINHYLQTVFPDTVYGNQTTQTRLASDTADDLIWGRYISKVSDATLREAVGRISFQEERTKQPLHFIQKFAAGLQSKRLLIVVGRSRRMATESHTAELRKLLLDHHTSIGAEATKTLGDVGSAVMSGGAGEGVLVVQARFTT